MDKSVAELNIEHYRKLLATEIDAAKRETVERLLGAEQEKLDKIKAQRAAAASSKRG